MDLEYFVYMIKPHMKRSQHFNWLIAASFLFACQSTETETGAETDPWVYQVNHIEGTIQITGKGKDPQWSKAELLTDFVYPWREEAAPKTEFRALWNGTQLYFLYHAEDPEIIYQEGGEMEQDAVQSDRVEIFMKSDDQMDPYYSLEMDALGRLFDSEGRFYRDIDSEWDWPEGDIQLEADKQAGRYTVEGSLSIESLRQLGMYKDDGLLKAGLYRGEYLSTSSGDTTVRWISWIRPDSEKPDFHIPSSFGTFTLK